MFIECLPLQNVMPRWDLGEILGKKLPKELCGFPNTERESSRGRLLSGLGHELLWGDKCLEDTLQRCGRTGGWGERLTRRALYPFGSSQLSMQSSGLYLLPSQPRLGACSAHHALYPQTFDLLFQRDSFEPSSLFSS